MENFKTSILKDKAFTTFMMHWTDHNGINMKGFATKNKASKLNRIYDEESYFSHEDRYPLEVQKSLLWGRFLNWAIFLAVIATAINSVFSNSALMFLHLMVSGYLVYTSLSNGRTRFGYNTPVFFNPDRFAVKKFSTLSMQERLPLIEEAIAEELIRDDSALFEVDKNSYVFNGSDPQDYSMEAFFAKYFFTRIQKVSKETERMATDAFVSAISYHSARRKWNHLREQAGTDQNTDQQMLEYVDCMTKNEDFIKKGAQIVHNEIEKLMEESEQEE